MEIELPVTLEDLYVGNEKSATIKRRIVCKNCKKKMHTPRCRECGACPKEKKMVRRRAPTLTLTLTLTPTLTLIPTLIITRLVDGMLLPNLRESVALRLAELASAA